VKAALRQGRDILFDIDWQGARQLEPDFGEHLVTIFLLPPTMSELEQRLHSRGQDSDAVIADRMRRAADEIDHWAEYEYVLVNRDMAGCVAQVRAIVSAERSKRVRQTDLVEFVRELIGPQH
jgi:guanylate kinase